MTGGDNSFLHAPRVVWSSSNDGDLASDFLQPMGGEISDSRGKILSLSSVLTDSLTPPIRGGFAICKKLFPHVQSRSVFRKWTSNGGLLDFSNGGLLDFSNGGLLDVTNGGLLDFSNGGLLDVTNGGLLDVRNGGLLDVTNGGLLDVTNGGLLDVTHGGLLDVTNGGLLDVTNGGLLDVTHGGLLDVTNGDTRHTVDRLGWSLCVPCNRETLLVSRCDPRPRMQSPCPSVETSLLLRDILHHKDAYNNSLLKDSDSLKDSIYSTDCNTEMISPLLHSKSSDMAYSARDNDLDNEDIEIANDNNSSVNEEDQSDDLDDRSPDASVQGDGLKLDGRGEMSQVESKEAKRANVDKLLASQRLSPHGNAMDTTAAGLMMAEMKRQKRKQPQPQQHDANSAHFEDLPIRRQIQQLEEQLEAMKRKRNEDLTLNDDDDTEEEGEDLGRRSKPSSPLNIEVKRPRLDMNGSTKPSSPRLENGYDYSHRVSPGSDISKRQKRKQTQPQQHENIKMSDSTREGGVFHKHNNNNSSLYASKNFSLGEDIHNLEDNVSEANPSGLLGGDNLFRSSLYRGFSEKDFIPPFHNGFNPQFYRDNLLNRNFFMRPEFDPMSAMRNVSKSLLSRQEVSPVVEDQPKFPPADITKIANAIKAEVTQVLSKAIDSAVSKVLNEKPGATSDSSTATEPGAPQHHPDRHQHQSSQQHSQQQQHQQQQHQQTALKHLQSALPFPSFLHHHQQSVHQQQLHHHQQQQQQQQQKQSQPQQPLSISTPSEREALKETVNNSQNEKKPELNVPFSEEQRFFNRFGSRLNQEKISAFEPISKSEKELISPHIGPNPFHFQYFLPHPVLTPMYPVEPEQTEALPLIVSTPKKKRTKVTDTRLSGSPRGNKHGLLQDNTTSSSMDHTDAQRHLAQAFPTFLPPIPSSVAITNPLLSHSDLIALRLREASFGDSRIPSPQDHSRSSPRSASESPHFMSGMYDRILKELSSYS
ncbi:hypothetical protein Btru_012048 [Bulinus truncatus]|nr:hypothetical protein Btru_012048 [Bulinus truncatus]